ncbi:MAG: UDP-N-acetylmuramoyl-L-alanine--D-glutamate ligase [bacterium]|nr:UDP-N-acetylmuramoyl-L-alanine--D-glutamate ligase [bacterium]
MQAAEETWNGKRVTIMGLGLFGGGAGLAAFLAQQGATVLVTDLRRAEELHPAIQTLQGLPVTFVLGRHRERDFTDTEVVFVNPAVPLSSPYLALARAREIRLDSEINLFVRYCKGQVIGITGSVGKSTTTAWLGSILRLYDSHTLVGGNFGGSLLPLLHTITSSTPIVLELSSFQLEQLAWQAYSPPLALILNLTANHLDRHLSMDAYKAAKEHIVAYQKPHDTSVFNWDEAAIRDLGADSAGKRLFYSIRDQLQDGTYVEDQRVLLSQAGRQHVLFHTADVKLAGTHNLSNATAAATTAALFGVPSDLIAEGIRQFHGLPHRMEVVGTYQGVTFYNDSKATTPVSTIGALQAFKQPVILLAGGYDKGIPFDDLGEAIQGCAKVALLYGKTATKLAQAIAAASPAPRRSAVAQQFADLDAAFQQAVTSAQPGDAVLLSPACASYDQFPHFEARGEHFRQLVMALAPG